MKSKRAILPVTLALALACLAWVPAPASAGMVYTGQLTYGAGGLQATSDWANSSTVLDWVVTENGSTWNYRYTLTVLDPEISHFVLETSPNFTLDFADVVVNQGAIGALELDTHGQIPGNPSIPGDAYGVKFDDAEGLTLEFEFDSPRNPIWGDVYAKGGRDSAVWNAGFTAADTDPLGPPSDGSLNYHVLVPDTTTIPPPTTAIPEVPEPASLAIWAVAIGAGCFGRLVRRRSKAA